MSDRYSPAPSGRSGGPPPGEPGGEAKPAPAVNEPPALQIARLTAEVADLRRRLEQAEALSEERLGQAQRLRADHTNYRRRVEQERAEERQHASAMLVIKLLPVLDDFERALDSAGPELAGLNWVQGIGQIARKFRQTLESEGLTRIDAAGRPFDPTQHEAVLREETDEEHVGRVLKVLQPGYRLQDRLIRPAMVSVGVARPASGRPADAAPNETR